MHPFSLQSNVAQLSSGFLLSFFFLFLSLFLSLSFFGKSGWIGEIGLGGFGLYVESLC